MPRGDFDDDCPARQLIVFMSDRWVPPLMYHLGQEPRRPSELMRLMPKISQKMLTQTLRNMESWGLIIRKDHQVVPPSVEYSLSDAGLKFNEALEMLCSWASTNEEFVFSMTEARLNKQSD
ncbi:MAG: helix-turn-helix transcriptional regulator [Pseudomonadales bacterium]|nr:helix-turn-helix transcriptional regulator [Pseudomonadales bacterium]MBO6566670.1 helix-turn-helix transcriptional regulator [Pseudomonadales bacterium]